MTEHPVYTVGYQSVESATFAQAALGLAHRRRLAFPAARLQIEQVLPLGDPILAQERASGFGTGKSYAIRALAREWQSWCDTHVVADADDALSGMTHLQEMLGRRPDDGRFRLLVIEDAGEILAVDAREKAGQAVSRLLNVTDGLASDALRTIILVTTNEPVGRLHPAIVRPGRCWAQIEIPPLPAVQAAAWLRRHGAADSA